MTTRIVLVPGFWLGEWAWEEVAKGLGEQGFDVVALTLPGLQPDDADRGSVGLQDHADAIAAALQEPADRRVLVVHSGAALPGTMVLDQHPEWVDHVVFVDTAPVADGYAMNPDFDGAQFPLAAAWDEEFEGGSMKGLSEEQLQTFRSRAVPQPARTVREAVSLSNPHRLSTPGTLVATAYPAAEYRSYAAQGMGFLAGLLEFTAIEDVDLATGHWPMWSEPVALTEIIARAAQG